MKLEKLLRIIKKKETVRSLCEKAGNTARLRVIKGSAGEGVLQLHTFGWDTFQHGCHGNESLFSEC